MARKEVVDPPADRGGVSLAQIAATQNKNCGAGTMITGSEQKRDPQRLPTGVFAVDYATGGGLPLWGATCFWGPESGGKSNLGISTMAMADLLCWRCFNLHDACTCSQGTLKMKSYWADVEGTFNQEWAACIGANPDSYVLGLADYGEQHINIAESVLRADDCGLVVIDSLAALIPSDEMDAAMEDNFIGLQARMITRMVRKLKQRLIRERKREHPCTVLFINQMRTKIGVMFGDPETQPGGHGLKHEFSLLLRCVKKSMSKKEGGPDSKYADSSRSKALGERFSFSVRKAKIQTLAGVGEYVRLIEDIPSIGLAKGQVDDFATLLLYAKNYGIVEKDGTAWKYFDRKASKLDDIKALWMKNPGQRLYTQQQIIIRAKEQLAGNAEDEE
jgi:recombination protein RecA